MAFATKYKTTIENWEGETITAEIQEDGFTGTVEEFSAIGGNPIEITHQANTNLKESYIIPSMATVSMYVNDQWDMHDLLYSTDRQHKVIIKNGTVEQFVGWVVAAVNTEAYTTGQYVIKVDCIDGLNDLKNTPYLNSGATYSEFRKVAQIMSDCLLGTGMTHKWEENCDIYAASGMTTTPSSDSPFEQCYIHTNAYGYTPDDVLSCWDVLEKICQAFYMRLFLSPNLGGSGSVEWVFQKINNIADTSYFRQFNSGSSGSAGAAQYSTLQSLHTANFQHVNGQAQISVEQAYKDIVVTTDIHPSPSLLNGANFEESDFATTTTLTNWGNLSKTVLIASWNTSGITQNQIGNDYMVGLDDYQRQHGGSLNGDTVSDNGSGKVRVTKTSHGLTNADTIIVETEEYRGIWRVQPGYTSNVFDITASYDSNQLTLRYRTINEINGIEYGQALALDTANIPEDAVGQALSVEANYHVEAHTAGDTWSYAMVVIIAWISSTNYKIIDSNGRWVDYNAQEVHPIIDTFDETYLTQIPIKNGSISVKADLSSSNNFYTTGSPKFYLALFGTESSITADTLKWNNVNVSMLYGSDQTATTEAGGTNYVEDKDIKFFHADGDLAGNDEFRFLNPIRDDAANKLMINVWDQGTLNDSLQDITRANLTTAYGTNSQIWGGTIKGDVKPYYAIKDPLNLDRIFQLQAIRKNLVNNYCNVGMIEIEPSEAYYVELMSTSTGDKYHLSTAYGNLTTVFSGGDTVYISDMRRKSDGAIVELGNGSRTIDSVSFSGGRTILEVLDMDYAIDPGAGLEVKGVLRIV